MRFRHLFGLPLVALSLVAQSPSLTSTAKDRKNLRLTIYQGGKAFVQESRTLLLPKGPTLLRLEDLTSGIDPSTFSIQDSDLSTSLGIKRQSYLYARPSAQNLLSRFEGKSVKVATTRGSAEALEQATLLSGEGGNLVLQFPDRVEVLGISALNRLVLPGLPSEISTKPQVEAFLESTKPGTRSVALAYVSSGFQWTPSYSVFIKPGDTSIDITAWAKVNNSSTTIMEGAQVDLLTGDLPGDGEPDGLMSLPKADRSLGGVVSNVAMHLAPPPPPPPLALMFDSENAPTGTNVGEHKVYALPTPLTLLPFQSVQVPFLEARGVKVTKDYRITQYYAAGDSFAPNGNGNQVPIETFISFKNAESEHLGRQLPEGKVRMYQPDANGVVRFIGDYQIPESVSGMEVRLGLGPASDLTAKRRVIEVKVLEDPSPRRSLEEKTIEYLLTNRKDEVQSVHIQTVVPGDWTLVSSSHPGTKEQANTLGFKIQVPGKGQTKLEYKVRTRLNRGVPVD